MVVESQHTHQNFVLIANPVSGKGKAGAVAEQAHQQLTAQGRQGRLVLTTQAGDANRIAREAVENGARWIIACGGDGTIHEIVNAIAEKPNVVLGGLPCGKGNDFAGALNIPTNPEEAIETLLNGATRQVDLGKIGDHYFDTIATCGYDAEVSRRVAEDGSPFSGTASYVYTALTTLFSYKSPTFRLEGDFGTYEGRLLLAATGITSSYGGGMKIVPQAIVDDGLLDVCIIQHVPRRTVLRMMVTLFWGGHTGHRAVKMHRTKSLTIETDPPLLLYADGERICYTPATIEIVERGLTVIVPADEGGEA
ncbi:MAG: diacylglycerol kinase family lipid kinase [Candidatus Poribacteria bacterium]|nr:diacylglycerol kinase family lipid kinase [Candidatus Poribacteria bacterium]